MVVAIPVVPVNKKIMAVLAFRAGSAAYVPSEEACSMPTEMFMRQSPLREYDTVGTRANRIPPARM